MKLFLSFFVLCLGGSLSASAIDAQAIDDVLAQTDARQEQGLTNQLNNTYPPSGLWYYEDYALAAYGLDTNNAIADAGLIACQTDGLYQGSIDSGNLHWHAYLLERIYFLHSSQSTIHPGRMGIDAENAVLEMLWDWASTECVIGMADPAYINYVWGSENHHLQAWGSYWGAAQIFADHPVYSTYTYADGSTPAEMAAEFDAYFKAWFRDRSSKGLLVEVASPIYAKYSLNPLYNLADFATDPELKAAASSWLDIYFAEWAMEQLDGVRGGSRHRCYPGQYSNTHPGGGAEHAWYMFGVGSGPNNHPGAMSGMTTLWRPSRATVGLALDPEGRGSYSYTSRPLGLSDPAGEVNPSVYDGYALDPDAGSLLRYTWCTPDFVMGMSQMEARDAAEWKGISTQNRWNGVIFGGHSTARIFTQRPDPAVGSVYNAEWGVQHKGAMILQRLSTHQNATGQAVWFDASLSRSEISGWIFAVSSDAYAAVRVVDGGWSWNENWAELIDEYSPVIIEVGRKSDYSSYTAFRSEVLSNPLVWDGTRLDYTSTAYATTLTLFADESAPPRVDGEPLNFEPKQGYDAPYLQGDFGSGPVIISYGDDRTVHGVAPFVDASDTLALWHFEALASGIDYEDDTSVTPRTALLLAVDFGGDYDDANASNTGSLTVATDDFEFGANATDDSATRRLIEEDFVTIPNTNSLPNKTVTFSAGSQYVNYDSLTSPELTQGNYKWRGLSDALQIYFEPAVAEGVSGMAWAPYVKKANFLNGYDVDEFTLSFQDVADSVQTTMAGAADMARALVQNGLDWYVSATSTVGALSLNGSTETWYPYDPSATLFFNENNLGTGVLGSTLTNIQAAGVLTQKLTGAGGQTFKFESMLLKVVQMGRTALDAVVHVDSTAGIIEIADGKFGNAIRCEFVAGDQYMLTGSSLWPADVGSFRYQGWIRLNPGDTGGTLLHIDDQVTLSVTTASVSFKINRFGDTLDASAANQIELSASISTANDWQYIEAVYDGERIKLVTEEEAVSAPGIGLFVPDQCSVYIGSRKNKSNYVGDMDEVKLSAFMPQPVVVAASAEHLQVSDPDIATNTIANFAPVIGADCKLVFTASWESSTSGLAGVTYAGESFSEAVSIYSGRQSSIWYLDLDEQSPSSGDVIVTFNAPTDSRIGVLSLANVAPGVPFQTVANEGETTLSLTAAGHSSLSVGVYTENGNGTLSSNFADTLYSGASGSSVGNAGYQIEAVAGAQSYNWSAANNSSASVVANFASAPLSIAELVDDDADGMADVWEIEQFGTLGASSQSSNADGDAWTDLEEFITGTDPWDPASMFKISAMSAEFISWQAVQGKTYRVLSTEDLTAAWGVEATGLQGDPPESSYFFSTEPEQKFFKIEIE